MRHLAVLLLVLLALPLLADEGLGLEGDRIHADSVRISVLEFTDVTGRISLTEGATTISGLRAKAYGGQVNGKVVVDAKGTRLLLIVRGIALSQLMACLGSDGKYGGIIDGEVVLSFQDNANDLVRGGGSLHLKQGSVISLPFLAEIFLGNALAEAGQDTIDIDFSLENNTVHCNRIVATNPSIILKGNGTIGFLGRLNLVLTPNTRPAFLKPLSIVGDILGWAIGKLSGVVGRFEIVGHIGSPVIRPKLL